MVDQGKPKRFNPDDEQDGLFNGNKSASFTQDEKSVLEPTTEKLRDTLHSSSETNTAKQFSSGDLSSLGRDLAIAMQEEGYHPVVLFGTNNSGKTSILMSLFATLSVEPQLETGLSLCDPILGSRTDIARHLHKEAQHTFEIKTEAFLAGEKIPKTSTSLPFFIPVEFRPPDGRPAVKFAFLESNGEWYRPLISDGKSLSDTEQLYPDLRKEIEDFIGSYQQGVTFIYTAPVTQGEVYAQADKTFDTDEIRYASMAIRGVLKSYDSIRANGRADDKHLMLVTKWDAISAREADRAAGIEEDRDALLEFCYKKYNQALSAFQGLNLRPEQKHINAYCAGMINRTGLISVSSDEAVSKVITSYPVRLWEFLYRNALETAGKEPLSPFKEPKGPNGFSRMLAKILDAVSGS
jgi:hypothetical protein